MSKTFALIHSSSSSLPSSGADYWKFARLGERRYHFWAWDGIQQGSGATNWEVWKLAACEAKWKREGVEEVKGGPRGRAEGKACSEAGQDACKSSNITALGYYKKKTDERHQNSPTLITSWKVMIKKRKK